MVVTPSPCPCWTPASLAAAFFCTVFFLILRLVSVVVLRFALPAVGYALLLPLVGYALLPAVGSVILGSFHLVPLLLYFVLVTTASLAVVPSRILTTGSFAVVPSVLLFQSLFVAGHDSVVRFWLPPTSLLSVALDPRESSLQQRVLLLFLVSVQR